MVTGSRQHKKQPPLSPFFKGESQWCSFDKGEFQWLPTFAPFAPLLLPQKPTHHSFELSQKVDGGVTSVSVVPTGLWVCGASIPSDESLGYYRKSLRDKDSA